LQQNLAKSNESRWGGKGTKTGQTLAEVKAGEL
jgi:hypothetical protein